MACECFQLKAPLLLVVPHGLQQAATAQRAKQNAAHYITAATLARMLWSGILLQTVFCFLHVRRLRETRQPAASAAAANTALQTNHALSQAECPCVGHVVRSQAGCSRQRQAPAVVAAAAVIRSMLQHQQEQQHCKHQLHAA
jgi:hypothetical protein